MAKPNNNFKDPNTIAAMQWKLYMKYNNAGIVKFGKESEGKFGYLTEPDQGRARLLRTFLYHPDYRPFIAIAIMYFVPTDKRDEFFIVNEDKK